MVAPLSNPTTPNPNTLMADLRMKSDKQLFDYAQMHKNDPYIFPMAFQESNARKKLRAAAQNTQAPPAPKVVDQNLQEMAQPMPEDQGIATLPAPNMQNMAGGGIVAFEHGGEVPGYAGGILVDQVEEANKESLRNTGFPLSPAQRARLEQTIKANIAAEASAREAGKAGRQFNPGSYGLQADPAPAAAPAFPPSATQVMSGLPAVAPPTAPSDTRRLPSGSKLVEPKLEDPTMPQREGLAALNTKPMSAEEAMVAAGKFGDDTKMRADLQGYVDRQKKIGEDAVGSFEKGIAGLPEAYKKYEARLQKEEAEAATDKDKAVGMSIFKAGLAMMSGTSQNAFENIGKGAMVGLEDQQAALKEFKKAQRERNKAFADIEQARLADQRGDLKTKLELESRAADRTSNAEGRMVEGIAKLFDTNKTNARGIYQTGFEQANQNQRTLTQVNADIQKQGMSDTAAMERTKAQVAGSLKATQMNADAFKLPMLYKSVEDSVDKMLQNDINYKTADEATRATMRDAALKKRLLATPGLAQYADATTGGGSAPGLRYNPQTGKIE